MGTFEGIVVEARAYTASASGKMRVSVSYEESNIIGNLTFDAPAESAAEWIVGRKVTISIEPVR